MDLPEKLTGSVLSGSGPGVLLLPAWWGLNDFFRATCERLGREGYSVLGLDLFAGRTAADIAAARALRASLDRKAAQLTIKAAADFLRARTGGTLGVMGFSLGANLALWAADNCARDVAAVVLFYGTSGGRFRQAAAPVMGHFAASDPYASEAQVAALAGHLRDSRIEVCFHVYPGTSHWFMEADRPEFDPGAAALAWTRTTAFLRARLRP